MTRAFAGVAFVVAALWNLRENPPAALFAVITGLVFLAWATEKIGWPARQSRRIDGIFATRDMERVLTVLLTDAAGLSGRPICHLSGVSVSGAYLCLDRLETAGWVHGEWETPDPGTRPRRRFYRLTACGRACALELLGLREWAEHAP